MKKIFRKFFPFGEIKRGFIALALLGLSAGVANAQTWEIGYPNPADVTATLDANGTMTVSGTGAMQSNQQPYSNYLDVIKNVIIQEGITAIGSFNFCNCVALTSVTIGSSVSTIGNYAFYNCVNLTSVTNLNPTPQSISFTDFIFNNVNLSHATLTVPCASVIQYWSATYWSLFGTITGGAGCFPSWPIGYPNAAGVTATLDANGTMTISGTGAMMDFYSQPPYFNTIDDITNLIIENGITSIGSEAFDYCHNLASVSISNTVTSIGDGAFGDCSSLKSVTIPSSVTSLPLTPPSRHRRK